MVFIAVNEAGGKRQLLNISLIEMVTYATDGRTNLHVMDYNGDSATHVVDLSKDEFERLLDRAGVKIVETQRARR